MTNNKSFTAEATYYNVSANSLFIALVTLLMTYYAWQKNGWSLLAKSLLGLSFILLVLTVVLFFSKLSIRKLSVKGDTIAVGKRSFNKEEIDKIECIAIGQTFHIHIINIDESLTLRMKEQYRLSTRNFIMRWCRKHNIQFIEK